MTQIVSTEQIFYVDTDKGDDKASGTLEEPFQSLDRALFIVKQRVEVGIRSDKIYLRGGVYRKESVKTLYWLELKGTKDNYAVISAMPAAPHAPGAVQRKSGEWYEHVIIDDAHIVKTHWVKDGDRPYVWKTNPGFIRSVWYDNATWPWRGIDLPVERKHKTLFTVAPYMLLQDGEPTLWAVKPEDIVQPGMRHYDQESDTLYLRPLDDKNPNDCLIETWYAGPEEDGKMLLDGEGRSLFDGNMEYAAIRGIEFRMFTRLFEFKRREMSDESERVYQRHVLFEDNECRYGWIQILLDANVVFREDKETFTRFDDRSNWHVRNNVFYRASREVCQLHGRNHIFEYNDIIERNGPWAGPAACVSIVNTRNTIDMKVRYNYIENQGDNPWHPGSVFMIESDAHADENGDYIFGGQTYEGNIIVNVNGGITMVLGKGSARMRNITIRNNTFIRSKKGPTIVISSPHKNLVIENNLFYGQQEVFAICDNFRSYPKPLLFESMPNTISIRNNIFAKNKKCFDSRLLAEAERSQVNIEQNLFYQNGDKPAGHSFIEKDPLFADESTNDFRVPKDSPLYKNKEVIGPYGKKAEQERD